MEPGHHDPPVPAVRRPGGDHQLPEGNPALLRDQLLAAGVDLGTVAGRLGHAEGSTTLRYYAQFTRPADQRAAAVIPAQLDELRKKERLRELFGQLPDVPDDLAALAAEIGPLAGLTPETALPWLAAFVAEGNPGTRRRAHPRVRSGGGVSAQPA